MSTSAGTDVVVVVDQDGLRGHGAIALEGNLHLGIVVAPGSGVEEAGAPIQRARADLHVIDGQHEEQEKEMITKEHSCRSTLFHTMKKLRSSFLSESQY